MAIIVLWAQLASRCEPLCWVVLDRYRGSVSVASCGMKSSPEYQTIASKCDSTPRNDGLRVVGCPAGESGGASTLNVSTS